MAILAIKANRFPRTPKIIQLSVLPLLLDLVLLFRVPYYLFHFICMPNSMPISGKHKPADIETELFDGVNSAIHNIQRNRTASI